MSHPVAYHDVAVRRPDAVHLLDQDHLDAELGEVVGIDAFRRFQLDRNPHAALADDAIRTRRQPEAAGTQGFGVDVERRRVDQAASALGMSGRTSTTSDGATVAAAALSWGGLAVSSW